MHRANKRRGRTSPRSYQQHGKDTRRGASYQLSMGWERGSKDGSVDRGVVGHDVNTEIGLEKDICVPLGFGK